MDTSSLFSLISLVWKSLIQGSLPDGPIIKLLISKALGYLMMGGAMITKLPQIRIILTSHSVEGLSIVGHELEILALTNHASYCFIKGLPFNAYGEVVFLLAQTLVLLALIYSFNQASTSLFRVTLIVGGWMAIVGAVLSGHVSLELASKAFEVNTVLFMVARLPQIISNFRARSTGQLTIFTYLLNTVGCVVRIFTTLQEGGGATMLRTYIISLSLNLTLISQILIFGNKAEKDKKAGAKETKKTK